MSFGLDCHWNKKGVECSFGGFFQREKESYEIWNFFFFPGDKSVLKDLVYWDEDCMGIYIRRTTMSKVGIID